MLNTPMTRPETPVGEDQVPHARAGVVPGVEFSAEDIRQIAEMRPEPMGRRGGPARRRSDGRTGVAPGGLRHQAQELLLRDRAVRQHLDRPQVSAASASTRS